MPNNTISTIRISTTDYSIGGGTTLYQHNIRLADDVTDESNVHIIIISKKSSYTTTELFNDIKNYRDYNSGTKSNIISMLIYFRTNDIYDSENYTHAIFMDFELIDSDTTLKIYYVEMDTESEGGTPTYTSVNWITFNRTSENFTMLIETKELN